MMTAKKLLAAGLILLASHAQAQAPAVLIEACNAIAESDKRLECLKAAMGAGSAAAHAQPMAVVSRAFAGMEASLNAGISYNNYQLAVLDLAKAVAAFKQDAGAADTEAGKLFESAVEAYSDAGTFWERSISFYARRGNDIAYAGGLPVSMNGLDWLVGKYGLATGKSDIWGIERGLPVQSTRSEIWRIAKQKAAQAQTGAAPKKQEDISASLSMSYSATGGAPETDAAVKVATNTGCSPFPFLAMLVDTPARKVYTAKCESGQSLSIVCADGQCKGSFIQ